MKSNVGRRFFTLVLILVVAGSSLALIMAHLNQPPGDLSTRRGDIHLSAGEYKKALEDFNIALEEQPDHRGALMGRALVYLQTDQPRLAEAELNHLITFLEGTVRDDDATGLGALAAAYANRGILHDRGHQHEQALADYLRALELDAGAVDGPGLGHRIIHHARPSSVRERALYLMDQLSLPESERVLVVPEIDDRQRMHRP